MPEKIRYGDLQDRARERGVDPSLSYEELREKIDIKRCSMCRDEFVNGWTEKFCSDACEVRYINKYYRD